MDSEFHWETVTGCKNRSDMRMPTTFCQHHPGDVLVFTVGLFLKGAFGNQFCNNFPDKVKYEQYAGMQKRRKKNRCI